MRPSDLQERLRSEIEGLADGARSTVHFYKYGDMSVLDENGNYPDDYYEAKDRLEAYGQILSGNELLNPGEAGLERLGIDADSFIRRFADSIASAYPGARNPIMAMLAELRGVHHGSK